MFDKRHLFTHRGGLVDRKFLREYNKFHAADPSKLLSDDAIGKAAFLERQWVRDSVREAKKFVGFVARSPL
jgi:hypothetical protein